MIPHAPPSEADTFWAVSFNKKWNSPTVLSQENSEFWRVDSIKICREFALGDAQYLKNQEVTVIL